MDVANYDEIVALKEKIQADLGEVDILINNAALLPKISLLQGNPEDILRIFKVNLVAYFYVSSFTMPNELQAAINYCLFFTKFIFSK